MYKITKVCTINYNRLDSTRVPQWSRQLSRPGSRADGERKVKTGICYGEIAKTWSRHQYLFFMGKTLEKPKNLVCEENHLGSGVGYA